LAHCRPHDPLETSRSGWASLVSQRRDSHRQRDDFNVVSQERQFWAEALAIENGETFAEISYRKGRIYWAAFPVELAEDTAPAAELYRYVTQRVGLSPDFELQSPLPSGVLIYPTILDDAVMYVVTSENAAPAQITLRDKLTVFNSICTCAGACGDCADFQGKRAVVAKYGF